MAVQNLQESASKSLIPFPREPFSKDSEGGLELGKVVGALRRRLPLIAGITTIVIAAAAYKAKTATPIYSAGFEILTESVTVETEVLSTLPDTLSSRQQQDVAPTLDATKIRVLLSPSVLTPAFTEMKAHYPQLGFGEFVQGVNIQVDNKNILRVSYSHPDPRFVKLALDVLSKTYLSYSLEDRQKDINQGLNFVETQLPKLQSQVSEQQEGLQELRQRYNLIDPESQAKLLSEQRGSLTTELLKTQTELSEKQLVYQALRTALAQKSELAASSPLVDSPRYQRLLDQLLEIDSKLAEDSTLYLDGSPELSVLQEQRRNLVPLLQREGLRVEQQVSSQIQELQNRSQSLIASIAAINQQMKQLSVITREYSEIQQGLEIATNNLSQFLEKREGLRIDAAQRQVPWRLLTAPNDPIPSSSNLKRTLALGTILGLLLGTGAALAIDRLSSLVHTSKEVKETTKLPVLGIIPTNHQLDNNDHPLKRISIPFINSKGQLATRPDLHQDLPSIFLEAFRSLYVNIRLMSPDAPISTLAISSAIPASGKTTIALYLAQVAAAMGQRVLLVDADLRRPSLHHRLQLANQVGLTNVVSGTADFDQALQQVAWEPNLFFMTAGDIPPDPTRILSSASMQQLIEKSQINFDLVIYDAPPILGFADTYLLASQMDSLLLVARLNHTKRALLEQMMEDTSLSSLPLLGVVVNDSPEKLPTSYTSYYQPQ